MASVNIKPKTDRLHTKLYKELDIISLKTFSKNWCTDESKNDDDKKKNPSKTGTKTYLDQYELFQRGMKFLMFCGECLFLMPVIGILNKDPCKLRFTYFSWRFLSSVLIFSAQLVATCLCVYRLLRNSVNIYILAFVCFYGSTSLTTLLFIRVAMKWPSLAKDIEKSGLDEYADHRIVAKCNAATVIVLSLSIVEHILSSIANFTTVLDCVPDRSDLYRHFNEDTFSWLFELGINFHVSIGIVLQLLNINSTLNWNYSDLFIMCMSIYLTSILKKIHEKIAIAKTKNLPSSFWRALREDYTRATKLVHSFDQVISSIIFTSFATNLFFICLQLFNILSNGIKPKYDNLADCSHFPSGFAHDVKFYYKNDIFYRGIKYPMSISSVSATSVPNFIKIGQSMNQERPFYGYEHAVYYFFSLAFILGRSIVVSLITAGVHSASMLPAYDLYEIPSTAYNDEIQRFLEQLHGDNVALSGLNFFYVTKELILSVAGTIVTYELVLLQFDDH